MTLAPFILLLGLTLLAAAAAPQLLAKRRLARRARRFAGAPSTGQAHLLLRRSADSRLDALVQRLLPRPAVLRARLLATGRPIRLGHYALASAAVGIAAAAAGLAMGVGAPLVILSGAANSLFLPHVAVGTLIARRRARFLKAFPEAIALMVRGLRAGLPVSETLVLAGQEVAEPVGGEFRVAADQIRLGASLEDALGQAALRIGIPEFNFLVISLSVQRETGGNLAETLENLEQILRRRQQMRLKIRAMSSEAAASALIIGALPFVMAVLMWLFSPAYIRMLFIQPLGRLMLAGGMASLVVGGLVMRQMVRFEI